MISTSFLSSFSSVSPEQYVARKIVSLSARLRILRERTINFQQRHTRRRFKGLSRERSKAGRDRVTVIHEKGKSYNDYNGDCDLPPPLPPKDDVAPLPSWVVIPVPLSSTLVQEAVGETSGSVGPAPVLDETAHCESEACPSTPNLPTPSLELQHDTDLSPRSIDHIVTEIDESTAAKAAEHNPAQDVETVTISSAVNAIAILSDHNAAKVVDSYPTHVSVKTLVQKFSLSSSTTVDNMPSRVPPADSVLTGIDTRSEDECPLPVVETVSVPASIEMYHADVTLAQNTQSESTVVTPLEAAVPQEVLPSVTHVPPLQTVEDNSSIDFGVASNSKATNLEDHDVDAGLSSAESPESNISMSFLQSGNDEVPRHPALATHVDGSNNHVEELSLSLPNATKNVSTSPTPDVQSRPRSPAGQIAPGEIEPIPVSSPEDSNPLVKPQNDNVTSEGAHSSLPQEAIKPSRPHPDSGIALTDTASLDTMARVDWEDDRYSRPSFAQFAGIFNGKFAVRSKSQTSQGSSAEEHGSPKTALGEGQLGLKSNEKINKMISEGSKLPRRSLQLATRVFSEKIPDLANMRSRSSDTVPSQRPLDDRVIERVRRSKTSLHTLLKSAMDASKAAGSITRRKEAGIIVPETKKQDMMNQTHHNEDSVVKDDSCSFVVQNTTEAGTVSKAPPSNDAQTANGYPSEASDGLTLTPKRPNSTLRRSTRSISEIAVSDIQVRESNNELEGCTMVVETAAPDTYAVDEMTCDSIENDITPVQACTADASITVEAPADNVQDVPELDNSQPSIPSTNCVAHIDDDVDHISPVVMMDGCEEQANDVDDTKAPRPEDDNTENNKIPALQLLASDKTSPSEVTHRPGSSCARCAEKEISATANLDATRQKRKRNRFSRQSLNSLLTHLTDAFAKRDEKVKLDPQTPEALPSDTHDRENTTPAMQPPSIQEATTLPVSISEKDTQELASRRPEDIIPPKHADDCTLEKFDKATEAHTNAIAESTMVAANIQTVATMVLSSMSETKSMPEAVPALAAEVNPTAQPVNSAALDSTLSILETLSRQVTVLQQTVEELAAARAPSRVSYQGSERSHSIPPPPPSISDAPRKSIWHQQRSQKTNMIDRLRRSVVRLGSNVGKEKSEPEAKPVVESTRVDAPRGSFQGGTEGEPAVQSTLVDAPRGSFQGGTEAKPVVQSTLVDAPRGSFQSETEAKRVIHSTLVDAPRGSFQSETEAKPVIQSPLVNAPRGSFQGICVKIDEGRLTDEIFIERKLADEYNFNGVDDIVQPLSEFLPEKETVELSISDSQPATSFEVSNMPDNLVTPSQHEPLPEEADDCSIFPTDSQPMQTSVIGPPEQKRSSLPRMASALLRRKPTKFSGKQLKLPQQALETIDQQVVVIPTPLPASPQLEYPPADFVSSRQLSKPGTSSIRLFTKKVPSSTGRRDCNRSRSVDDLTWRSRLTDLFAKERDPILKAVDQAWMNMTIEDEGPDVETSRVLRRARSEEYGRLPSHSTRMKTRKNTPQLRKSVQAPSAVRSDAKPLPDRPSEPPDEYSDRKGKALTAEPDSFIPSSQAEVPAGAHSYRRDLRALYSVDYCPAAPSKGVPAGTVISLPGVYFGENM
ncbi:uncharacterized protein SPPG_05580 [Spizellomyces punctatus DAOM BR117]|uniref:Uncharacterized protein n=1 Tax=Spizellomyces punctatus (strain DAOM BR117) TaxID=645134 RepID=A0A0L0HDZ8_SPIPD|nr:uncharacterized protein SPPG_05580 [Spizellomyces punctatus DAOM BR117]KNC99332.1 hypothetical protein SPPG_05580 [Spizellomyces punctatus DAOM BR117]|eukprot:XP_016607372.1 hypothetical protein SPPG_05580 [Spizellomyces punctatus DAOM BR117]